MIYLLILSAAVILLVVLFRKQATKVSSNSESLNAIAKEVDAMSKNPKWNDFIIEQSKQKKRNTKISSFIKINLVGLRMDEARKSTFKDVHEGDSVVLRFDIGNKYDDNAIGVYTESGNLLGYVPKDNKRLIGAMRRQSNRQAKIILKRDGTSQWEKEIKIELSLD